MIELEIGTNGFYDINCEFGIASTDNVKQQRKRRRALRSEKEGRP